MADTTEQAPQEAPETQEAPEERRFTQAEVNRYAGERAKRAEESTRKRLLEELGIEDVAAAREALKRQAEQEEATKTELQRRDDALAQRDKRLAELEAALEQERQAVRRRDLRDGFRQAARTGEKRVREDALEEAFDLPAVQALYAQAGDEPDHEQVVATLLEGRDWLAEQAERTRKAGVTDSAAGGAISGGPSPSDEERRRDVRRRGGLRL